MRYLMRLITISIVVISAILIASPVIASPGFPNAIGCKNGAYYGARAQIETADPYIRDGLFSMVRVFAQNQDGGHNWFAEAGWYKGLDTGYVPKGRAIWNGPGGYDWRVYQTMAIGSKHIYLVMRDSGDNWGFYIDGTLKTVRYVGFASTTRVCSGGETSTTLNAMGVSGCLQNKRKDSDGIWRNYGSHYNVEDLPYDVRDIDANNWQVSGNN